MTIFDRFPLGASYREQPFGVLGQTEHSGKISGNTGGRSFEVAEVIVAVFAFRE